MAITWYVGGLNAAAAWLWGRVIEGELAAVLQQLKGPHYQPVTAPIQRSPAGQWPAGRCEI